MEQYWHIHAYVQLWKVLADCNMVAPSVLLTHSIKRESSVIQIPSDITQNHI